MSKSSRKAAPPVPHNTEDIEHVVISSTGNPPAPPLPAIDKTIQRQIAKYNLADAKIAELRKAYAALTIADAKDAEGYKLVSQARATIRTYRTGIEKKRVELNEDALKQQRAVNAEAKRLTAALVEIETPLATRLKEIDDEKEAAAREKQEAEQRALHARVNELLSNGAQFNGSYYGIGDSISIDVVTLKSLSAEDYANFLQRVTTESEKIAAAVLEEQRLKDEETARLEQQRKDQEAEQKRQEDARLALEREMAQMKGQRTQLRRDILKSLGFKDKGQYLVNWATVTDGRGYSKAVGDLLSVNVVDFSELSAEEWEARLEQIKTDFSKLQASANETAKAEEAENVKKTKRVQDLIALGYTERADRLVIATKHFGDQEGIFKTYIFEMPDDRYPRWLGELESHPDARNQWAEQDAAKDKEAMERAENERTARLSDAEKVNEVLEAIEAELTGPPQLESAAANAAFSIFQSSIKKAIEITRNALK